MVVQVKMEASHHYISTIVKMWRRPSNFSSSATTTTKIEDLLVRKPTGKSVRMNGFSVALPLFFPLPIFPTFQYFIVE